VSSWSGIDGGATLGTAGSESGTILLDDEHPQGAHITVEGDTKNAPFAITCGIYGWMVHTRFFGTEAEARDDCAAMKQALEAILALNAGIEDQTSAPQKEDVVGAIERFVRNFP
jgi:hypothetical protein